MEKDSGSRSEIDYKGEESEFSLGRNEWEKNLVEMNEDEKQRILKVKDYNIGEEGRVMRGWRCKFTKPFWEML